MVAVGERLGDVLLAASQAGLREGRKHSSTGRDDVRSSQQLHRAVAPSPRQGPGFGRGPVAIAHRVVWVVAVAADGGVMFHVSHPRHYGDSLRRVVLASPLILAGAFLGFLLVIVLGGATNGFNPNP